LKPKCLVVINPGNPTGAIFSEDTIKKMIKFATDKGLVLIADEVYRENIYKENAKFISFRKVLNTMDKKIQENC
jgi:alanine transaminase